LVRIVGRCLEKNPTARFQSTPDLAFALEGIATPSDTGMAVPAITGRPTIFNRARLAWAVAALSLIAVLALSIPAMVRLRERSALCTFPGWAAHRVCGRRWTFAAVAAGARHN
jgi:hypothetical protein